MPVVEVLVPDRRPDVRDGPTAPWSGGHGDRRTTRVLLVLLAVATVVVAAFMLLGIRGSWAFALELRATKVAAMVVVAAAVGTSTVLFQTITTNRILTPSIMGFDALYVLIQSAAVYWLGALEVSRVRPEVRFALETAAMVGFALILHRLLFGSTGRDLHAVVLAGVVCGTLFTSGSDLVGRLIDPNEFVVLADRLFASVNTVREELLVLSTVVVAGGAGLAWRARRQLDVVALGRETALGLGIDHRRAVTAQLVLVAVLVAVPTALVGPVTFLGLLTANLARQLTGTSRHAVVLPAAALLGVIALVGGQLVLERLLGFGTALGIVVNLVGGLYFLMLLMKEGRR